MKRRTFIQTSIAAAAASAVFKPFQAKAQGKKYVFGFSQATIVEPWRVQFNKDMKKEAEKYPDVELIITDGQDQTEKQVADVESLIQQGVDLLLISPKESGIKSLLQPIDCDWKQAKGYDTMTTALKQFDKIDLVYGHNDPIAYGAYLAAKDAGREKEIKFLGIDALPDEGVTWVCKNQLTATFVYATPGVEGVRHALKVVKS